MVHLERMVQSAIDYLNLAFRNNALSFTARLVHTAEAPAALDGPNDVLGRLRVNKDIAELRARYNADIVHFFSGELPWVLGYCGQAYLAQFRATAESFSELGYGVTSAICSVRDESGDFPYVSRVFAHEVGHNLGGNHDPMNTSTNSRDYAIKPWAYGHSDINRVPSIETIMSYRSPRTAPVGAVLLDRADLAERLDAGHRAREGERARLPGDAPDGRSVQ